MCLIGLHTLRLQATRPYKYESVDCVHMLGLVVICCNTQGNCMAEAAEQIYITLTKQCMYNKKICLLGKNDFRNTRSQLKGRPRPTCLGQLNTG